jgi:hypothetical protein
LVREEARVRGNRRTATSGDDRSRGFSAIKCGDVQLTEADGRSREEITQRKLKSMIRHMRAEDHIRMVNCRCDRLQEKLNAVLEQFSSYEQSMTLNNINAGNKGKAITVQCGCVIRYAAGTIDVDDFTLMPYGEIKKEFVEYAMLPEKIEECVLKTGVLEDIIRNRVDSQLSVWLTNFITPIKDAVTELTEEVKWIKIRTEYDDEVFEKDTSAASVKNSDALGEVKQQYDDYIAVVRDQPLIRDGV